MNDKFVPMNAAIYKYLESKRSDLADPVLHQLCEETAALGDISAMQIAPEQGTFLTILVAAVSARNALEIGTFTGYSSLCIARGLAPSGRLNCLDRSGEWTDVARKFWERGGVQDKITLTLGDANETLPRLVTSGTAPLDFVFIDADKPGYDFYFETVLPHCRTGALIIFDNMLRGGRLIDQKSADWTDDDRALNALNNKLSKDCRVQSVLLAVADGLNICRKI